MSPSNLKNGTTNFPFTFTPLSTISPFIIADFNAASFFSPDATLA
ncbi:MAG: hypothetical protein NTZ82_02705 [Bacteroidetes bacterium]|nr:hypothetical protein [Bacteroidota bacterium]